jgi:hypothetical protein
MKSNLVDIPAKLVHQTEKAFLFDFGLKENIWLPKSQCEWDGKEVTMTEDLAADKGLDNLI